MTIKLPTRASLEKTLADVEAEAPSPDRAEAITKIKKQIAELPEFNASIGVNADGSPKDVA